MVVSGQATAKKAAVLWAATTENFKQSWFMNDTTSCKHSGAVE
jgi:hypothetical protein